MRTNMAIGYQKVFTVLILLLSVNPAFTGYSWSVPSLIGKNHKDNSLSKGSPQFDDTISTEISVVLGQTAYLPCVVHDLGDRLVSWIRTRDLHILTNGKHTFTADPRFEVVFDPEAESWTLRIVKSRLTDVGKYECQVNTDPKMNMFFSLNIRETPLQDSPGSPRSEAMSGSLRATIAGPQEQFVKSGSTLTLECRLDIGAGKQSWDKVHARFATRSIPNVQWLKDGYAISFQAERGGISVETERGEKTGSSRLTLASVGSEDSGQYTCMGTGITPSSINLHVIEGDYMEAMQRDDSNALTSTASHLGYKSAQSIIYWTISSMLLYNIVDIILLRLSWNICNG